MQPFTIIAEVDLTNVSGGFLGFGSDSGQSFVDKDPYLRTYRDTLATTPTGGKQWSDHEQAQRAARAADK